jgi:Phospholipase_D-nuclease N-terminal
MIAKLRRDFVALSPVRQSAIVAITAWNVSLIVLSQRSLNRTPARQIRGPKALWRLACLTNSLGPLAYFLWGRSDPGARPS